MTINMRTVTKKVTSSYKHNKCKTKTTKTKSLIARAKREEA